MNEPPLQKRIRERIEAAGGWLPFDAYMEAALYEPELGYYERAEIFGEAGDFVTAADLGPWLALALADLIAWGWETLGRPGAWTLVEQGGGSGRLMRAVVEGLAARDLAPSEVLMIERSSRLREVQRETLADCGVTVVIDADPAMPAGREPVILFSNELPDAFPVRCFRCDEGGGRGMREMGVAWQEGRFVWQAGGAVEDGPVIAPEIRARWPEGYTSEWNPGLARWQRTLADGIARGFVFTVDYGYAQPEYYREGRIAGTLMGHRGHRVIEDVLTEPPGSCDITAHVDFTALTRAAAEAGFQPLFWMTQGGWLAQSPSVQERIRDLAASPTHEGMAMMAAAKRLMMPTGMGESFKILAQSRGLEAGRPPFLRDFDRLDRLIGGCERREG
ncbi:MAG: SAM-dependent methyltransferase [Mariprofundaceae bacterium]